VVVDRAAEDVDDDGTMRMVTQRGKLLRDEALNADVLQADGVDHAGGGFNKTRGCVAGHRLRRDALSDEAADPFEVYDLLEFNAVAEGAAGGNYRADEAKAAKGDPHVGLHCSSLRGPSADSGDRIRFCPRFMDG